jgi:hypothetical protein
MGSSKWVPTTELIRPAEADPASLVIALPSCGAQVPTSMRVGRNAAELCEVGPTLKRPYDHKLVLDRIKRLLAARAQQGRR